MYQRIFENECDASPFSDHIKMKKQIETVRENAIQKLAPLCPALYPETFSLMFANAWHEDYAGIQKIANDLDIYKLDIFALEDDLENFKYQIEQEEYLKFDGDY